MSVTWNGFRFSADAEKCYREIQSLECITPANIVDYARSEDTELHKCFQWDDSIAAENWRKQQARIVVSSLVVTVEKNTAGSQKYRLIQHDDSTKEYKPVVFTVRNMDEYGRLLAQAKRELRSFKERYKSITELSEVIEQIEIALAE